MTTTVIQGYIESEHRRAELQRLEQGWAGCGCGLCQDFYRTLDLSKFGARVKVNAGQVTISESPWLLRGKGDGWKGDVRVVDGLRFIVGKDGSTICQGENGPTTIADLQNLALIRTVPNPAESCSAWDRCKAPLCPLDESTVKHGVWYPDEEVCSRRGARSVKWVRTQYRVAKRAKRPDFYFQVSDLSAMKAVRSPTGHDPDLPDTHSCATTKRRVPLNERGEKNGKPSSTTDTTQQQGALF
jgi:hypothetical protein